MSDSGYMGRIRKNLGSRVHVETRNEGSLDGILTEIDDDTTRVETPTGARWIRRNDIITISLG